jgi:hypothetical protein
LPTKSSIVSTTNSTLPTSATSSDNKHHAVLPEMFGDFDPLNLAHQFDIIVSNPPYIPQQDELTLQPEVVKYEDPMALFGGEHGLDLIMDIVDAAPLLLLPSSHHGGRGGDDVQKKKNDKSKGNEDNSHYANIWMEMDTSHPALLKQWLSSTTTTTTTTTTTSSSFSSSNNGDSLDTQKPSPPSDSTLSTDVVFKGKKAPNSVKFVNSHVDVFGNIRFCSLKV